MAKGLCDKLDKIIRDIERDDSVPAMRLTVFKKWLEVPARLQALALFIARRAIENERVTVPDAKPLFAEAATLLDTFPKPSNDPLPEPIRLAAWTVRERLYDYQKRIRYSKWTRIRIITNYNLYFVEAAIDVLLRGAGVTSDGYKLAADFCSQYEPRAAYPLNKKSLPAINRLIEFVRATETSEANVSGNL